MKFTLVKDLQSDTLMRPVLMGVLVFILLFLGFDILNASHQVGLGFAEIHTYVYGNEEEFIDPISFASLLEYLHLSIFLMMMLLLTLSAIYARLCPSNRRAKTFINLSMLSAISSIISLLIAPYFSLAIYLYSLCFWTWHIIATLMSLESLKKLL